MRKPRQPAQATPATRPPELTCVALGAFSELVAPQLTTHCLKCHDGSKRLATTTFDLRSLSDADPGQQPAACGSALLNADTVEPGSSPLLLLVDPADRTTDHEFRFAASDTFAAYRSAILRWLENEAWPM